MSSMNTNRVSVTKVRRKSTTIIVTVNSSQYHAGGEQIGSKTVPNLGNVAAPKNTSIAEENLIDINFSINPSSPRTSASNVKVAKIIRPSGKLQPANDDPRPNSLSMNNRTRSSNGITVTKVPRVKTSVKTYTS
ncbi:unnamed protein product [Rotaria sp. Silwood1]|nr:unnamed protein product [Rotaria sp. Silwood1]